MAAMMATSKTTQLYTNCVHVGHISFAHVGDHTLLLVKTTPTLTGVTIAG